jgi:uncharacterized protein (DUF2342 family)
MFMADPRAIDWDTAQRIGELIAGSPRLGSQPAPPAAPSARRSPALSARRSPPAGAPGRSAQDLAHDFARRVSAYTGLQLPAELPPLEMVDRPGWIAANLATMRPLLEPVAERLGDGSGLLRGPLRGAPGHLLGAQLGVVTGLLSQRVLGQYDVSLLDDEAPPRLLLLAPNLAAAARNLKVDHDELIAWVAIHEITHAVQFSGAPWLREHLGGMLRELLDGMQLGLGGGGANGGDGADAAGAASSGGSNTGGSDADGAGNGKARRGAGGIPDWLTDPRVLLARARELELGELVERARRGELLRVGLGEERWRLVERMQATMSLIEGHAEHTMDAVGAEVLPSLPRLRAALTRRRESRGLPWRVLEKVLGLELKMRQYEVGRQFCDAVVAAGGPELLAVAWRSPAELPSGEELAEPGRWIARVRVLA